MTQTQTPKGTTMNSNFWNVRMRTAAGFTDFSVERAETAEQAAAQAEAASTVGGTATRVTPTSEQCWRNAQNEYAVSSSRRNSAR